MRRKMRSSKRILVFLLLPLFTILISSVAYGALQDYVAFEMNLTIAEKPTIAVTCTLVNTYSNSITVLVNSTTKIIQATEPAFPLLYINITNTGRTSIDNIMLNDMIPEDWKLREVRMRLVHLDQTQTEINATDFTMEYKPENNIITITFNIKNTLGKTFDQYESIIISTYIEYKLKGQPMPPEYETNPQVYTNTATTAACIGSWQNQPTISTLTFTTNITEI